VNDDTAGAASPPASPPPARRPSGRLLAFLGLGALLIGAVLIATLYGRGLNPVPLPSPTSAAVASPSSRTMAPSTSAPPPATASIAPTPSATPTPATAEERLLGHVPEQLRPDCVVVAGSPPVSATATCTADGGRLTVTYLQYADATLMDAAYDGFFAIAEIERDSGNCARPETWPAEGVYLLDDQPAGRMLCTTTADLPTIYWTNDELLILGFVSHTAAGSERLWQFWREESGPYP
jgi:hypothetical protein